MKYQLKGVMASTEKDSVNLGYPTLGGGKKYARVVMSWRRDSIIPSSKELNNIKE